ncbi:MAG: hypothetical protein K2K18_03150, partial [Malacoplasma sp.]|nr:hypothetical protein [Malacoplasma sp.]
NQIDIFKNVTVNDVLKEVKNPDSEIYSNMNITRNSNTTNNSKTNPFGEKDVFEEINKNMDKFTEITENILSGKTQIEEINKNLEDYKNKNSLEYENILEKISDSMDVGNNTLNSDSVNNWDRILLTKAVRNKNMYNILSIVDEDSQKKVNVDIDYISFALKSRKFLSTLNTYKNKTEGVSVASAVLTAASWAIAAFYWSAWWMFGGNVVFAVAATVQAGLATASTTESFTELKRINSYIDKFNKMLNSKDFLEFEEFAKYVSSLYKIDSIKELDSISYSFQKLFALIGYRVFKTEIINYLKKGAIVFFEKISSMLSILSNGFKFYFGVSSFDKIINIFNSAGKKFLSNLVTRETAMKAVSWASPAATFISVLRSLLDIADSVSNLIIFSDSELTNW